MLQASVRSLQIAKETQKTPNFGTISKQMGSEYRELSVAERQPYVQGREGEVQVCQGDGCV